jgi:hypothetical protein
VVLQVSPPLVGNTVLTPGTALALPAIRTVPDEALLPAPGGEKDNNQVMLEHSSGLQNDRCNSGRWNVLVRNASGALAHVGTSSGSVQPKV